MKEFRILWGVIALVLITIGAAGCSLQKSIAMDQADAMKGIRLIAVMPISGQAGDEKLMRLMREKVLETLYFKGYPKIPLQRVDEKFTKSNDGAVGKGGDPSLQDADRLPGVDAGLYIDLKKFRTATALVYASTSVSATFELRSVRTGETLWRNQCEDVIRHFGFTRSERIVSIHQVLEPAMQEMVDKALQTLPEGPDAVL